MRVSVPTVVVFLIFVILDSLAFYGAWMRHNIDSRPLTYSNPAPAPDVVWKDFDGREHKFKDLAGHVVVVHFWASWCGPCREEFPALLRAAAEDKDVMFLTVSSDEDRAKAEQFIRSVTAMNDIKSSANVLYAWDPAKTITYDQFLTARYPESIIVDKSGRMRRKFPAPVDWGSGDIRDYLSGLEAGK